MHFPRIMRKDDLINNWNHGFAGALSGVFTRFTCQPFDVLKIRFQVQTNEKKYRSIIQTVALMSREEGVKCFWKGHLPGQWLSAIYGAAQFASYERLTRPWPKRTAAHFSAGAASGVIAVAVSYPFDVVRTRLAAQAEPKIYNGMIDVGRKIVSAEGWRGLFKGLLPACIQTAPLSALVFGIHHLLLRFLVNFSGKPGSASSHVITGGCAATAGFTSKLIVYPFDLVKKRLQIQGMPDGTIASGSIARTSGLISCVRMTLKNEGIKGLYKGLAPSLLKATVSNAVYLTSYGWACQLLGCVSTV